VFIRKVQINSHPEEIQEKILNNVIREFKIYNNKNNAIEDKLDPKEDNIDEINADLGYSLKRIITKICATCKKTFITDREDRIYCSCNCTTFARRKCERPSAEKLKELIDSISLEAIGRQYKVSGTAVKKWAKKYKLI
jgi:hypothetical protein